MHLPVVEKYNVVFCCDVQFWFACQQLQQFVSYRALVIAAAVLFNNVHTASGVQDASHQVYRIAWHEHSYVTLLNHYFGI